MPNLRTLLHLAPGLRRAVDIDDVYYLEAQGAETEIRLRGSRSQLDVRPLADLEPLFAPHGFLRIHRGYLVNPDRIREIRRRDGGQDWELKLEPPVSRVLPISRTRLKAVWAAFEGGGEAETPAAAPAARTPRVRSSRPVMTFRPR